MGAVEAEHPRVGGRFGVTAHTARADVLVIAVGVAIFTGGDSVFVGQSEFSLVVVELLERGLGGIEISASVFGMACGAARNIFEMAVDAVRTLDLLLDAGVAGFAQFSLVAFERLVAEIALAFKFRVRMKVLVDRPRFFLGADRPGVEERAARKPGRQTQTSDQNYREKS